MGLGLLLAGCGGASGAGATVVDPTAIAAKIHCAGLDEQVKEMFGDSEVTCTLKRQPILIVAFASLSNQSSWMTTADQAPPGTLVVGKDYVIEANSGTQAHALAATLGDSVK
jgi:hypothetical protein